MLLNLRPEDFQKIIELCLLAQAAVVRQKPLSVENLSLCPEVQWEHSGTSVCLLSCLSLAVLRT